MAGDGQVEKGRVLVTRPVIIRTGNRDASVSQTEQASNRETRARTTLQVQHE